MSRRRAELSRADLLRRYVEINGVTSREAFERHADTDLEDLRGIVESLERQNRPYRGQRSSFAAAQQTTTVQGVTR